MGRHVVSARKGWIGNPGRAGTRIIAQPWELLPKTFLWFPNWLDMAFKTAHYRKARHKKRYQAQQKAASSPANDELAGYSTSKMASTVKVVALLQHY